MLFLALPGRGTAVHLTSCHIIHMLKQNKGVYIESEEEKDISTPGDKPRMSYEGFRSM